MYLNCGPSYFIWLIAEVCVLQRSDVSVGLFRTTSKFFQNFLLHLCNVYHLFFFEVYLILDLRTLSEWEVLGKSPKQFFPIGKNLNL